MKHPRLSIRLAWALWGLALLAGCSRAGLLFMDSTYEAPTFSIAASNMGDGRALLTWPLDRALVAPDLAYSNDSFSVFYAYYLYRSDLTPWRGYRLVGRLFNPLAQWEVTNVDDGKPEAKDLRLSTNDALNHPLTNLPARPIGRTNEVWWTTAAPGPLNYFRVERVKLERESSRDTNDMLTRRTHKLKGDGFSSWVEPGRN
ncbi:MAG: hypothetical protein J0L75_00995 [Spirochaetes bacterium]|nr:hypothetical protein [Spirochaetota bacterium]